MRKRLFMASLFDGSGGFPLAGALEGIFPVWASEIEPFPIRVTTKRFPYMKHYGDVSKINGAEVEEVDIITFGSPCQDLSVAGKRAGLQDGERSSLFYQAIRIIKEMREATNGKYPRFIVWENVPGAFSSNGGDDFRCVLESICKIKRPEISIPKPERWERAGSIMGDGYSVAWRMLDAQYWGVTQRRKRVFVVADFGGECADEILFERTCLQGDSEPSGEEGEGASRVASEVAGASSGAVGYDGYNDRLTGDISCTLTSAKTDFHHVQCVVLSNHANDSRCEINEDGVFDTLTQRMGTGGNNQPMVMVYHLESMGHDMRSSAFAEGVADTIVATEYKEPTVLAYAICSENSNAMKSDNPNSGVYETEVSKTIDCVGVNPASHQGGIMVCEEKEVNAYGIDRYAFNQGVNAKYDFEIKEEVEPTLVSRGPNAVATIESKEIDDKPYGFDPNATRDAGQYFHKDMANTLTNGTNPGYHNGVVSRENEQYIVRRITPTECARLQGFPDSWCDELETENPTEEDLVFWRDVFETHRKIVTKTDKPKTDNQIIKFLQNPKSDSAMYKMWGNGVALPCVRYIMGKIRWFYESRNY